MLMMGFVQRFVQWVCFVKFVVWQCKSMHFGFCLVCLAWFIFRFNSAFYSYNKIGNENEDVLFCYCFCFHSNGYVNNTNNYLYMFYCFNCFGMDGKKRCRGVFLLLDLFMRLNLIIYNTGFKLFWWIWRLCKFVLLYNWIALF